MPVVGDSVDGYTLEEKIGAGGYGIIFRGKDESSGEYAAVKILHEGKSESPSRARLRLRREAETLRQLNGHPRILRFIKELQRPEHPYIVTELLRGETLEDILQREKTLPLHTAITLVIEILRGVHSIHKLGRVHKDLKPDNIFLLGPPDDTPILENPRVKIIDFGTVDFEDGKYPDGEKRITMSGMVVGTPLYMSPEQARALSVDRTTDLYAVGLVLFELITGKPPYHEGDAMDIMISHVDDPVPRFPEESQFRDTTIDRIIQRALQKEPKKRYQQAHHMMLALYSLKHSLEAKKRKASQPT